MPLTEAVEAEPGHFRRHPLRRTWRRMMVVPPVTPDLVEAVPVRLTQRSRRVGGEEDGAPSWRGRRWRPRWLRVHASCHHHEAL
jgi:hypothetical protein